ncbi:mechanosensitive ion channel family protein [Winogradskyella helgolandensis]|uniref:mechanosensitive ion channel family protein n=1 Tax=Winogradskyella helgolandensis TaxID=2697010 RepID=UPI0015B85CD6|nr:hypothetical protein [Winogradskyella helgolandensis]
MEDSKEFITDILSSSWPILLKIVFGFIGVIVALYLIKVIVKIIIKLLNLAKIYRLDAKLNDIEIIEGKKLKIDSIKIISTFIKYILYVLLIMIASETLGLEIISNQISDLISYAPKLISAVLVFVFGLLFANFVKNGLKSLFESMDMSGGKAISQVVFFLLLTFISVTALNQAGIDTEIISNNINMIIAAFLLAFAIAFGLGAREVVGKLLNTFYARKIYEVGQKIVFNDDIYTVEAVQSISVILKNSKGKLIVPIKDIVENQVQMQD